MSDQLDLTLPLTAPSVARFHATPQELHPAALYTLVDLPDAEMDAVRSACQSQYDTNPTVTFAPRSRFVGETLRAVFDYHQALDDEAPFDKVYFIVAAHVEWREKGVLLVALDDDELQCRVDWIRVKAEDAGLIFVNLQIANSSWSEEKESARESMRGDDEDGDEDGSGSGSADIDSGGQYGKPPVGFYIPIYVREGIDADTLIRKLEPGVQYKQPSQFCCRLQGILSSTSPSSAVDEAFELHPVRCRETRWLHANLFLVADSEDYVEDGLVLCHVEWDGATCTRSPEELAAVGATAPRKTQRVEASSVRMTQEVFIMIARGLRAWQAEHPLFAVFEYLGERHVPDATSTRLLGHDRVGGLEGTQRVQYASSFILRTGHAPEFPKYSMDEALRWFPWMCREYRFFANFNRRFFVWVDRSASDDVGEVTLVKVPWDGVVKRTEDELVDLAAKENWKEKMKTLRVEIKEAYSVLQAGVEGVGVDLNEEQLAFFS